MTKESYIERVRKALELDGSLSHADYLEALEELAGDLDGMLEAAREEAAEVGDG